MILKFLAPLILFVIAVIQGIYSERLNTKRKLKVALIILLVISLIVTLFSIQFDEIKSNKESFRQQKNIDSLRRENRLLTVKLDSLHLELKKGMSNGYLQNIELKFKVQELNSKLEPFIKIAITKYPQYDIQSALNKLTDDIESTKKLAEPPSLIPIAKEVSLDIKGLTMLLQFKPSKNQSLGQIEFNIEITSIDNSRILDFWPVGGSFSYGPGSKKIAENGRSAKLSYSLISAGYPTIQIIVSRITNVKLTGNYLEKPILLRIAK